MGAVVNFYIATSITYLTDGILGTNRRDFGCSCKYLKTCIIYFGDGILGTNYETYFTFKTDGISGAVAKLWKLVLPKPLGVSFTLLAMDNLNILENYVNTLILMVLHSKKLVITEISMYICILIRWNTETSDVTRTLVLLGLNIQGVKGLSGLFYWIKQ